MKSKNGIKKLLQRIEQAFDMKHACSCEKWCNCWENFKKKELKKDEKFMTYTEIIKKWFPKKE